MASSEKWWSVLSDECPITLEPLSELPYPPFILYSNNSGRNKKSSATTPKTGSQYFFDGLALATYVISQGNFANPLTRNSLSYEDCVRLDEYLNEHVYNNEVGKQQVESTVLGSERISVREAHSLRNAIKVKVGSGSRDSEAEIRRAEVLRNEAAVALRGLFVFGHNGDRGSSSNSTNNQAGAQQQFPVSAGGFDLNYNPDSNQNHSWGMNSILEQEGLRIVDDNEAAFQSADTAAWQEIQDAFPHLAGTAITQSQQVHGPSDILDVARRTAELTLEEERLLAERRERNHMLNFLQALERKKQRIMAKQKAKAAAVASLASEQQDKDELQAARQEIDRWRDQQWKRWERDNLKHSEEHRQVVSDAAAATESPPPIESDEKSTAEAEQQAAAEEEALANAAAKKKAKRQRAKERAKEKKKEEQLVKLENERVKELQKQKDNSELKCGACGDGILGCGFDKFDMKFCSTKCARSGPMSE